MTDLNRSSATVPVATPVETGGSFSSAAPASSPPIPRRRKGVQDSTVLPKRRLVDRLLRAGEGRLVRELEKLRDQVNLLEPHMVELSDDDLRALTDEFRTRLRAGESLDDLLPEAFAAVREASRRVTGMRHFDVQIMGGAALHMGNIAEMRTGEGKTLVSTLPAYLNALAGAGVHIVTVNDYLAQRDAESMGRIHRFLGLTVGVITNMMPTVERRAAYACDITYGTNNEFGFDYLRDNMADTTDELVQRGHSFAIVDEVDSILIDEARTPLIISGSAQWEQPRYEEFARLVASMQNAHHYEVDEKKRTVGLLEPGIAAAESALGLRNLYDTGNTLIISLLNNAIRAKELYTRDRHYVVMDGQVLIVDEHTGRILAGRRYSEGLHQSIEAKEGVVVQDETQTLATVTLQNYFRLYTKLSGMTGTAATEAAEFHQIYKLGVVPIPTNRPMVRVDHPDMVYRTRAAKLDAVVEDISARHRAGQPVLVGTTSVAASEELSAMLLRRGVRHEVLNAKNNAREAHIIAQAGRLGAVTVATNMAGRGTDIMLGGNADFIVSDLLAAHSDAAGLSRGEDLRAEAYAKAQQQVLSERERVVALGGLYVLGTERHESRRIDNQLRGRSGRQGDPGASRFYLSLQDDLMRLFKADTVDLVLRRFNIPDNVPIEAKMVSNAILSAQTQVEGQHFEMRKNVLKYDEVLNAQRLVVYGARERFLYGDLRDGELLGYLHDAVRGYVDAELATSFEGEWDLPRLLQALELLYPCSLTVHSIADAGITTNEGLHQCFERDASAAFEARLDQLGPVVSTELQRRAVLVALDRRWREHLYEMDYLKEGIHLRSMAQRDPLVEYRREGFDLFHAMHAAVKEDSVGLFFSAKVELSSPDDLRIADPALSPYHPAALSYTAPDESGVAKVEAAASTLGTGGATRSPGRNEACPCGSGRKFKRCHGGS